ncbi:MAG: glutamate-5-semialdehyde dehydrogenase [Candidatus Magnetobacterium sp. LHC-1]|uniref:Gamma-glutamyl phosphate reductase n=1 Tax=Candidatus Magnetobacterium casense TaxID=1455061 RepID=A0ABS6S1C3_9BACT|nr:glutamate-5-semialdehyde dehydrogenase [Candidatus Magnetobacterium casensis]MBF0608858.1 glutamate-5-semialdehyde dehydrogenase [Nitrospirota bacterium]MBV6342621.1 glutamate-5-semialdehyde dehydrogenase [Candidatus Magnetobacterium casensis]
MDLREYVTGKAFEARDGARELAKASGHVKKRVLVGMADAVRNNRAAIIAENARDVAAAREKGLSEAMIDRLTLNDKRIEEMAAGLTEVSELKDPVGEITNLQRRPNDMMVGRMRVPIGVVCIIYESRPNVTADAAGLCLMAGNAVILKGGSEAIHSNMAIVSLLRQTLTAEGLHAGAVTFIDNTQRAAVMELIKLEGLIDLIIPRGGEGLIRSVTENARIPVLKHYKGVCHVFVDAHANLRMAQDICFNAKVQRPGTCNAMETMLVDSAIAAEFLPAMVERFRQASVELLGCPQTTRLLPQISPLTEQDYYNEYLSLKLNIRIVDTLDEAIRHIATYSSNHTDTIVTDNYQRAMRFLREVDSAAVLINASTRLNDGGQFGLGAEIGISTDKIHARGPMGIEELTCNKFVVFGNGQLRG